MCVALFLSRCLERRGHSLRLSLEHPKELLAEPTSRDCKREILYPNESSKITTGDLILDPRSLYLYSKTVEIAQTAQNSLGFVLFGCFRYFQGVRPACPLLLKYH